MKHTYLITTEQREPVAALIRSVVEFTKGHANFVEVIQVETEDERLAQVLDQILGMNGTAKPKETKMAEAKPRIGRVVRICEQCGQEFHPKTSEKLCQNCRDGVIWLVISTGEQLKHADLTKMLTERTIPIGTVVNHPQNGTFAVVMKHDRYFLEQCKAE